MSVLYCTYYSKYRQPTPPPPRRRSWQAFFIGVQIEVEDAEVMPFPTTRQTLQEMLLDEEEKDFWDEAELAPAQERAVATPPAPTEEAVNQRCVRILGFQGRVYSCKRMP